MAHRTRQLLAWLADFFLFYALLGGPILFVVGLAHTAHTFPVLSLSILASAVVGIFLARRVPDA